MNTDKRYDLFLSYHWRDHDTVEPLAQALRQQGLEVFLDRWYLVPGRRWQTALENVLLTCRAAAVLLGPNGLGNWQQREKELALDRQARDKEFSVIPVLLPGAEPALEFLSLNTWVDLRKDIDNLESLRILVGAARGEAPGPTLAEQSEVLRATICPFRGLSYFREEDAPFFFGREAFSERLTQEVACRPLVAVVGASGCGKSSVVRAGLLPRLRRQAAGKAWEFAVLVPGDRPLRTLAATLLPLLEPGLIGDETDEVKRLERVEGLSEHLATKQDGLRNVVERILEKQPGTDRLLLVVDQWEELYTFADATSARAFVDILLQTTIKAPLSVVLTLRGDFYGHVLAHRPLADSLQDAVMNLGPMTEEELRRVVVEPLKKIGLDYEPGLDERILKDVGAEPGYLPLLEFVLKGLWEARRGGLLHHAAYETMGGVEGAMAQRAEEVWKTVHEQSAKGEDKLRRVFLDLVHTEEGARDTRRRIELDKLDEAAREVVVRLADERLLVTGRDEATGKETLEVAHEALIRHWGRLKTWLDADREFRTWRHGLAAALAEWERSGRKDQGTLLRGGPLAEAERWQNERGRDLNDDERNFIRTSTGARQRRNFCNWGIAVTILLALAGFSLWQWQELAAERARRTPVEPVMVTIHLDPQGFMMGSGDDDTEAFDDERPQHKVVIVKPYAIGKYEVTFEEYDKFAYDDNRRPPSDQGWGGNRRPVINVSWEDAGDYAAWLSKKTGKKYRLPSEAEWEYAARAGTVTRRFWGDDPELKDACRYAGVYDKGSVETLKKSYNITWEPFQCEDRYLTTAPKGSFDPNAFGLYDMLGNVWEWTEDCWNGGYAVAPEDGSAWTSGDCGSRVIRGGSWNSKPRNVRSAIRDWNYPAYRSIHVGFRLAQDL